MSSPTGLTSAGADERAGFIDATANNRMGFATLNKDFIPELLLTPSSDFATLRGSLESVHYFEGLAVLANP